MLMDPDKHPSFYKLLFKEESMDKILMPPLFIKDNKKMLAKTCILKMDEGTWEAKIVREEANLFITGGDWPQFVVYHKLELGDVLLFFLVGKSTFQVLPYHRKFSRGEPVFEELSGCSSEEEGDVGPLRTLKKVKMEPDELLDSRKERLDPTGGTKDGENPYHSHSGFIMKVIFDDKADNMLEARERPPGFGLKQRHAEDPKKPKRPESALFVEQGLKRGRDPAFLEESIKQLKEENPSNKFVSAVGKAGGDELIQLSDALKAPYKIESEKRKVEFGKSMDTCTKIAAGSAEGSNNSVQLSDSEGEFSSEEESSSDSEYSGACSESRQRFRMHKKRSKSIYDKDGIVMDKERSIAHKRAREHASKSMSPFIICLMRRSYISGSYCLAMNGTFFRKFLGENCCNIRLRVNGKGAWPVNCSPRKTGTTIVTKGWREFVQDNELKLGDVCVFEVTMSADQPLLDVTIFRAAEDTTDAMQIITTLVL